MLLANVFNYNYMKAINITKFNNQTEHFYATFWNVSSYVDLENVRSCYLTLKDDVFSNMEKDSNIFTHIKNSNEKELLKEAKKKLIEYCGFSANIILVFNDGVYSESRTDYMSSLNIC